MKPKTYNILRDAIERGISYGVRRAYKHTDTPSEATLEHEIDMAIWNEIHECFDFKTNNEDES